MNSVVSQSNPLLAKDADATPGVSLRCDNVDYEVDGRVILSGISFESCARRIGIVGRNGSGKTTLSRILAGLVAPTAGKATINEVSLAEERKAALDLVGILFQNPDRQIIFPTVEEELVFGLRQMGVGKQVASNKAIEILARFGKSHWRTAPTHLLSQGQKQLLCLMAVLLMNPKIIILDEPFAGLDIPTRLQLERIFDDIPTQILHVSHDPQHLKEYDNILWIEKGCLHRQGPPSQVLPEFFETMTNWGAQDDLSDLPS